MVFRKLLPYISTAVLSIIIVLITFRIFKINLAIPLNYTGDAIVHYNFAKNIQQTGWWFTNPSYGAPDQQTLYDFPLTENIQLLFIKTLILLGLNWVMSVNIFFVLTFPLTAVVSLYVLRKFDIKTTVALPLSVIYAFIPYHFYRGVNHLFLAAYFTMPISILASYTLASGNKLSKLHLTIMAIVMASSGAYYTFFSCYFILMGVVLGVYKTRSKKLAANGMLLLAATLLFFALNLLPTIIYRNKYGHILNSLTRSPRETEIYGMKITQLLLPIEDHNLNVFNKIYKQYEITGYENTINENQYSSLGIVSATGFLVLVFWSLFGHSVSGKISDRMSSLSSINLAAVLFATTGGFSLIVSTYLNPTFRSVNRISIFIAFFAVATVGLLLQNIKNKNSAALIAWIILPIALFDQISFGVMRNLANNKENFDKLQTYAKQIDVEKTKIYTLPFGQYPEGNEKKIMKLALLTNNVAWSVGAPAWRASNYWQYNLSQLDPKTFLDIIVKNGFNRLLIYKPDYDTEKIKKFDELIKSIPLSDANNEFLYYDLTNYIKVSPPLNAQQNLLYYISGNCLHNYNGIVITQYWCVNSIRIEFENKTGQALNKTVVLNVKYPSGNTAIIEQKEIISTGNSHVIINKSRLEKGIFPIPRGEVSWPLHLGYPNIIVSGIQILD